MGAQGVLHSLGDPLGAGGQLSQPTGSCRAEQVAAGGSFGPAYRQLQPTTDTA